MELVIRFYQREIPTRESERVFAIGNDLELPSLRGKGINITDVVFHVNKDIVAYVDQYPTRIDYDKYFNNLWLMDEESDKLYPEPYCMDIERAKPSSTTVWRTKAEGK